MIEVIEFEVAYPNYKGEETATEKLLGIHKNGIAHTIVNGKLRTYIEFWIDEKELNLMLSMIPEHKVMLLKTTTGVEFKVAKRNNEIVAICLATKERVRFTKGFKFVIK